LGAGVRFVATEFLENSGWFRHIMNPESFGWFELLRVQILPSMAHAVALSWILLALGRQWRAEPSWIDRMGRAFGAVWILGIPFLYWLSVVR
jgi:hypothetical protein